MIRIVAKHTAGHAIRATRVDKEGSLPTKPWDALACLDRAEVACHNSAHSQSTVLTSFLWQTRQGYMRDVSQVLREKTDAIAQVRREVEALRAVTPFLADPGTKPTHADAQTLERGLTGVELGDAIRSVAELLADEAQDFDPGIRARLIEAGEKNFNRRSRRFSWLSAPRWPF